MPVIWLFGQGGVGTKLQASCWVVGDFLRGTTRKYQVPVVGVNQASRKYLVPVVGVTDCEGYLM